MTRDARGGKPAVAGTGRRQPPVRDHPVFQPNGLAVTPGFPAFVGPRPGRGDE